MSVLKADDTWKQEHLSDLQWFACTESMGSSYSCVLPWEQEQDRKPLV